MTFTYDLDSPIGEVRLLCTDTEEDHAMFSDEEIKYFLKSEGKNVKRAGARALETIASSQTLLLKVVSTLDTSMNGPQVAKDLREGAKQLRKDAEDDEERNGGSFAIAEQVYDIFGERERLRQRRGGY